MNGMCQNAYTNIFLKLRQKYGRKQKVNKRKPNESHRIKQVYEFEQLSDKEATGRKKG
jgi:hypothetical protein